MQLMISRLRRLGVYFAMGLMCAVAVVPASAQDKTDEQGLQQIALTEGQIKGYLKIGPDLAKLFDRIDKARDEPDKKLQADLEAVAKKGGFKSFDELESVVSNVTFVMSGINDEDGSFQEPAEVLKEELKETEADKELKGDEKKEMIAAIKESIALTPKLKFPENIKLVQKHFKALASLFQE